MLPVENGMADFQKRQEQALIAGLEHPSKNQTNAAKLLSMHMLLQSLQKHLTPFEFPMSDFKFAVHTSLEAADMKMEACQTEYAQLRSLVQNHGKLFQELLPF